MCMEQVSDGKLNKIENMKDELREIFNNINEWLKFAEAKNFGLLSLNAAVVFGFLQIDFAENSLYEKIGTYMLMFFATLSFFPCLLSLFPIITKIEKGTSLKSWINKFSNWIDKEIKFENIHFYGFLKDINEATFQAKYIKKNELDVENDKFNQYEIELVSQILYNSRITWLKYQLFKIGAFFFLFGIVILLPLTLLVVKCFN